MSEATPTTAGPAIDEQPVESENIMQSFSGPFFAKIAKRKEEGRDAKILVTASDAQTGVGKSNLCDFLAYVLDTTDEGFVEHKITIEPEEFFSAYGRLEKGSALVMEEGEQLDPRRSMSKKNVEASHSWQMERVREVTALINLPSPQFIDKRMEQLADFWVNVLRRGRARIYEKKIHDTEKHVYYRTLQDIEWPNMDGSTTFREMDELKKQMIDGELGDGNWMPPDEHQEKVEKAKKEATQRRRNELLADAYKHSDLSAREIATWPSVDISFSRVAQVANKHYDEK
jgi:hypothetical protein